MASSSKSIFLSADVSGKFSMKTADEAQTEATSFYATYGRFIAKRVHYSAAVTVPSNLALNANMKTFPSSSEKW